MSKVQMTKYEPVPEGVYNMTILQYDKKESQKNKGQYYYQWRIRIDDVLPDDYTGKGEFSVLTACELTEKNNLKKFLYRVGYSEIEVGQEIELDDLVGFKFVGKVTVKALANGDTNELVDVPLPEYDKFLRKQQEKEAKARTVRPSSPSQAQKPGVTAKPATSNTVKPRPMGRVAPGQTPPAEAEAENEAGGEEQFPE